MDNGDVETFKKEPEEALARETGQNSNDARYNSSYTKMEYKLFEVEHDAIPGIDELSEMIEACYEYKKELPKEAVPLKRMLERSHDKKIKCLRISDFYTSGLEGVLSNDAEKPFYLLTKGSFLSFLEKYAIPCVISPSVSGIGAERSLDTPIYPRSLSLL